MADKLSAVTYAAAVNKAKKYTNQYLTTGAIPKGSWDAATNTPTLSDGVGTIGWYYDVITAGHQFGQDFLIGDRIIYADNKWQRVATGVEQDDTPMVIEYIDETTMAFPDKRQSGKDLLVGDSVRIKSTANLPFTLGGITFDSYGDAAVWNGTAWQEQDYAVGKTNEIVVNIPADESLDGVADYQSDVNKQVVNIIGKGKTIQVSDKDNIIDSLNYLAENDDITINRDANGNLQFKPKTSADEKKGWRVKADGTWELTNFKEFKVVDTFDSEVGNDYTLYILTRDIEISGVTYKFGFYTWDSVNGFIIRSVTLLIDNNTIGYNNNGELTFKIKTANDKDKVWKVNNDGSWGLKNIKEWQTVDSFASFSPNNYTLYILTTDCLVSGVEYKKGFYTWDSTNGYVMRSAITEVDDDKIAYDSNNKLTFKSKTSNDEDKAWKVDQNGDWGLENIGEIVIVDSNRTFNDVKKREHWLYFVKEDIIEEWAGLKITSKNKSAEIYLVKLDATEFENPNFYKSSNGIDWVKWNAGNSNGISLQPNESVYIWNKDNRISTTTQAKFNFVCDADAQIECSGNIMSMINFENLYVRCFQQLFQNCVNLTKAPDLPATQLVPMCYYNMFSGCTNLTTVPELPATSGAEQCYDSMFKNCTNLIVAPEMKFDYVHQYMCEYMFSGCTNLNSIKLHYTGDFDEYDAFKNWVRNVSSNGTIYYNGPDTTRGNNAIPTRWTIQTF